MISLVSSYLLWHYSRAFKDLYSHVLNFLWFFYHLFSLPVLAKTFFKPWKRMEERYPKGLDVGGMASTFMINTMMRIIGAIMRAVMLFAGGLVVVLVFCAGVLSFLVWAILPALTVLLFISGARLLFI